VTLGGYVINTKNRNFDQDAASWDQLPRRVKVAQDIAQSMIRELSPTPDMDVLDFGCGTGLLALALQPFVRSVTGVDSSPGMLDVFETKIKEQHLSNVNANHVDLDKGEVLTGSYHLIVSSMTLHHVKDISLLLKQCYSILLPSGLLAIADLDLDDGKFHSNNDGVFHFGFDRAKLRKALSEAGFNNVQDISAAEVEKETINNEMRQFTLFLMTGKKV